MKVKIAVWLSVCVLLLIMAVQYACMRYAYDALKEKTLVTLDGSFKKAFGRVVDDQINNLPYPDGTVTHYLYYPIDSTHTYEMEDYSFYISQQSSAILQDYYHLPEISLDSLRQRLEKELRFDGVRGRVTIQKVEVPTGELLQESSMPGDKRCSMLNVTSCRAWLHEANGIAVQARLDLPFSGDLVGAWLLFSLLTSLLSVWVIGILFVNARRLLAQKTSLDSQRQDFYRQAEEMERPLRRIAAGINGVAWKELSETVRQLQGNVEGSLTRAKQEYAQLKKKRVLSSPLFVLSFMGMSALVFLWGVYCYRHCLQEVARLSQVSIEEAFVYENVARSKLSALASGKKSFREFYLNGKWTEQLEQQTEDLVSVFYEEKIDSTGKKQYVYRPQYRHTIVTFAFVWHGGWNVDENARLYSAYGTQQLMEEYADVFIPVDSIRMDSLFNARLRRLELPAGQLYFFRVSGDSLSSDWTKIVTSPLRIREDRSEWMQARVPVTLGYVVRVEWHIFLPLLLVLILTLFCVYIQWIISRRQRKLEQFVRDFTYSMIHDMKSPLQSILMGAQIMASGKLPEGSEKAVRICAAMADECDHLLTLSNRVVTLTQMERGELELHKTAVVLRPLLDDLSGKFRLKAPKPVAFEVDCPSDFRVMADAFCLREVLSNLIDNAIKYSREEVSIRLSAESGADGGVVIRVRDNGIGIPPREQQRIFGKFERVASGSRATGASGFGLGLNFVWQVVRAHGGRVEVRSDGMSYSEFAVVLPG